MVINTLYKLTQAVRTCKDEEKSLIAVQKFVSRPLQNIATPSIIILLYKEDELWVKFEKG